jgi:hypothetical protein
MAIKHVGAIDDKKVVVAYRTLPGDPHSALVIPTASLSQTYHDELFTVVDSKNAQDAYELATVLSVRKFSDGYSMLGALHQTGVGIDELALTSNGEPGKTDATASTSTDGVLSDDDLAQQYRAQADSLYKEVQELRKKADELSPKKTTAKKTAKIDA